ncbi:MAG: four-carbon acid sugar kinase family protein [Limnohabitans sp.]
MKTLRILADDLTGALDCAAAFGAGISVHLGQPINENPTGIDIVATATRDVPAAQLPALLNPSLGWLSKADVAFKKVDSLLRGNTLDEVDWLARQAPFSGLAFVPAFPAQQRVTEGGQQWWSEPGGMRRPVAASIRDSLQRRGWRVEMGACPPSLQAGPVAWVPDVLDDLRLEAVASVALQADSPWLWCGSAGLAHAMARRLSPQSQTQSTQIATGPVMLVSASHHPVSREQWRVLRARHGDLCHAGEDPRTLHADAHRYPALIDLMASQPLTPEEATALLHAQTCMIAAHAPRPRALVVVGGDTLLALCQALGATGLQSEVALDRPGWGCARMLGGRWDGLVCHTRSGAFGDQQDLLEVLSSLNFSCA